MLTVASSDAVLDTEKPWTWDPLEIPEAAGKRSDLYASG